jgi:hypothetical protein
MPFWDVFSICAMNPKIIRKVLRFMEIEEDNTVIDIALTKSMGYFLPQTCISVIIWQVPSMGKKLEPRVQSRSRDLNGYYDIL